MEEHLNMVSVPIRGLFNLTSVETVAFKNVGTMLVSVPIRGLFNLTCIQYDVQKVTIKDKVSVPIRGLFNLTQLVLFLLMVCFVPLGFRPHQGII